MATKPLFAVGMDAGAARTRCVIGVLEDGVLRYVGHGEGPSGGWTKGRIADQNAAAQSILTALREAETRAQVSVKSATLGIGGPSVRGNNSRSSLELGRPREIVQRDVNRAVERASRVQLREDRLILHLMTQDFVVDSHPGHRDPRKMVASRLEANIHLVTASEAEHQCLVAAANQAHLAVEETVFEAVAGAFAAVLPEDRREGVAFVDIGSQSTEIVVYYGEAVQLAGSLPICGDHFTRDVARGLGTGIDDAELLKVEYGSAAADQTGDNSLIDVPSPGDREPREAPRRKLNRILEARADELFGYVRGELARVGMAHALMGGVVITGGMARLHGMCDVAERVLDCQARNGLAVGIEDWPEEIDDPVWVTAAGLAMYSARLRLQGELENQSAGLLGRILR
ncbi:MAG: cell division protein FtsA [Bryobacteraceae bacterium]